jgi:Ca2+-binding RTX toxin-like protein
VKDMQCGFVINGEAAGDKSGYSVSSAGDVNGDGLDDPKAFTVLPLLLNTLRILVLVEAANRSFRLSSKVLLPEPLISIISISRIRVSHSDEIFVAGAGNDTLTGNGGMDVFNAGLGTDSILINASNITALKQTGTGNRARVDGGGDHYEYRHHK